MKYQRGILIILVILRYKVVYNWCFYCSNPQLGAKVGADYLEKVGLMIGKVVAVQPNWGFPNMGVALKEFTTVIPKFAKMKYVMNWMTNAKTSL